jgi:YD repeat-containing protein
MQTMTDPRGVVTKYEYDTFGRLYKVTQADRVIKTYDYHYKN